MKFRNEVERWHKLREYSEYMAEYTAFRERGAVRNCIHYEFNNQSAEEYCWCSVTRGKYGAARALNGESEEVCWKCQHYEVQSSDTTTKKEEC